MTDAGDALDRLVLTAAALFAAHPPRLGHPHKRLVFDIACPPGAAYAGTVGYSRWAARDLPATIAHGRACAAEARAGFYDYAPPAEAPDATAWHVNFADPELFGFYGSGLFAQDEIQTAEHPALGALREALAARGLPAHTVGAGGAPTPVLVTGVERRCAVATEADPAAGRPHGLYGNAFARAREAAVRGATRRLNPPTVSNIVAMAAPGHGRGRYRADEIAGVLSTACTAFAAAVDETARLAGGAVRQAIVHTGFWGCGAFGGNRVLMAALQLLAADLAGIDRLVFHTATDAAGAEDFAEAERVAAAERQAWPCAPDALVARLAARGFAWGVGDGN